MAILGGVRFSGNNTAAYFRVSSGQQSIDQQNDAIAVAGITPDRVFINTASGRAGSDRPGSSECMRWLRAATISLSSPWIGSGGPSGKSMWSLSRHRHLSLLKYPQDDPPESVSYSQQADMRPLNSPTCDPGSLMTVVSSRMRALGRGRWLPT